MLSLNCEEENDMDQRIMFIQRSLVIIGAAFLAFCSGTSGTQQTQNVVSHNLEDESPPDSSQVEQAQSEENQGREIDETQIQDEAQSEESVEEASVDHRELRLKTLDHLSLSDRGGPARPGATLAEAPRKSPSQRFKLKIGGEIRSSPATHKNGLIFVQRNGRIVSVDPNSGQRQWTKSTLAIRGSGPAIGDGAVFVAEIARNGSLRAFELDSGAPRWKVRIGPSSSSPIVQQQSVFILSPQHNGLISLNSQTGDLQWATEIQGFRGSPALSSNRIIVSTEDHILAFAVEDGSQAWEFSTGAPSLSPAIIEDRVFVTTTSGELIALDIDDGSVLFRRSDFASPLGQPALGPDHLYVVSDENLLALSYESGQEIWSADAAAGTSPVVAGNGVVVALTSADQLTGYDAQSGTHLWDVDLGRNTGALPTVSHNAIFVTLRVDMEGEAYLLALE